VILVSINNKMEAPREIKKLYLCNKYYTEYSREIASFCENGQDFFIQRDFFSSSSNPTELK